MPYLKRVTFEIETMEETYSAQTEQFVIKSPKKHEIIVLIAKGVGFVVTIVSIFIGISVMVLVGNAFSLFINFLR